MFPVQYPLVKGLALLWYLQKGDTKRSPERWTRRAALLRKEMGLGDKLRKLMVIDASDQVSYCNRTVQVGPHVLVVTCATLDSNGEGLGPSFSFEGKLSSEKMSSLSRITPFVSDISRNTPA